MKTTILILVLLLPDISSAEELIYAQNWNLKYHIEDGRIYDKNWQLKGHIQDGKIYDRNWQLKGRIEEGKPYDRIYDPSYKLEGIGKETGFMTGPGHQRVYQGTSCKEGENERSGMPPLDMFNE